MQEEQFTDLEQPSEEDLNSIKQEYGRIKKQQSEIQQLQKLQQQITQQIDTEIIKYFTYFSQFFKKHQQKDTDLSHLVTLDTEQTITANKTFNQITASKIVKTDGTGSQILLANDQTANTGDFLPVQYPYAHGSLTLEPNNLLTEGIRIMKNKSNWNSFVFTSCNEDIDNDDGVWVCGSSSSEFKIQKYPDSCSNFKGLVIDFECEKLMFNQYQLYPPPPEPPFLSKLAKVRNIHVVNTYDHILFQDIRYFGNSVHFYAFVQCINGPDKPQGDTICFIDPHPKFYITPDQKTGGHTMVWFQVNDLDPARIRVNSAGAINTDWSLPGTGNFRAFGSFFIENADETYHDP